MTIAAPPVPTPDDTGPADLLRRAAAGHADAWATIVARYTRCCAAACAATGCRTPTRTTSSRSCGCASRRTSTASTRQSTSRGGCAAVASRECLRVLHEATRTVVSAEAGYVATDPETGPEQLAVDAVDPTPRCDAAVARAVATLPPRRRALVQALFADDGRSYARISRDIGHPDRQHRPDPRPGAGPAAPAARPRGRGLPAGDRIASADPAFVGPGW